ncbi:PleD family two-component system response regulator [Ktedonobacter sp. SOSP1-52]|uniref:response regulator n=1 Tax=Ktedonobacter sp. SOSP1-52 TaxID=2778366 RepID=UPI001F1C2F82|nr:response regulator [Ktedonobacter sp. SOSP1-52]
MVSQRKPTRFLLIVEESETTWKVLQRAIEQKARYLTLVAKTSEEAIRFARNIQPSLVLIQYHLPDLNGIEVYHRLKAITPEKTLPTIVIVKEGEKVRHEPLPELHLLEEPYSLDMLLQLLKHLSKG